MAEQDKISTLDQEIDAATHVMIEAEGNGWTNHIEKCLDFSSSAWN